jgi:hypothetical protein
MREVEAAGGSSALASTSYGDAVSRVFGAVCRARPSQMEPLFAVLAPYVKGNFIPQRVVAILVIGSFVCCSSMLFRCLNRML